uniref:Uncharacterized protein n=1 Tax=Oryza sativa subsp. japonica TaxID=39947 RepID=Q6KAE9_ORYSJ|nr:hypothetical protein [Oryza sativa Japonica Group]
MRGHLLLTHTKIVGPTCHPLFIPSSSSLSSLLHLSLFLFSVGSGVRIGSSDGGRGPKLWQRRATAGVADPEAGSAPHFLPPPDRPRHGRRCCAADDSRFPILFGRVLQAGALLH